MSSNENKLRKNKKNINKNLKDEKLTKEETAIAKYLRFKCPSRKGSLMGMKVDFFIGSKAIDYLMQSKWSNGDKGTQILFKTRNDCVNYMQELLNKSLFHRAIKIYKDETSNKTPESTPKAIKRKQQNIDSDNSNKNETKRKFKLEMHDEQLFVDANEPYVWIYDPPTPKALFIGTILIAAAIAICLFPLWPTSVREGVYYLSLAGAWFLGIILGLAVFKYILFIIIWLLTIGYIHFWVLPNLTEDVGFFQSFWPLYTCTINKKSIIDEDKPKIDTNKNNEETDEFNKLPLDEQLMQKFDEEIDDEQDENLNDENKKDD